MPESLKEKLAALAATLPTISMHSILGAAEMMITDGDDQRLSDFTAQVSIFAYTRMNVPIEHCLYCREKRRKGNRSGNVEGTERKEEGFRCRHICIGKCKGHYGDGNGIA